jgi:hypothetical protein
MRLADLHARLKGVCLRDVITIGFFDREESPIRYYPQLRVAYFQFSAVYLRCDTDGYSGRMRVGVVASVVCDDYSDEGMSSAWSSVREYILREPDGPNQLTAVHLWDAKENAPGVECAALQFDLGNGQGIFVDPFYHFGIKLGGPEQQALWAANRPPAEPELTRVSFSLA